MYIQVKRSKLHYAGANPPIFPCADVIEWILQKVDLKIWVIRDHSGKMFANVMGKDEEVYYVLPTREQTFNTDLADTHEVPITETLKGWWEDPEKFKVKKDQEYKTEGLRKVYKFVAAMMCRMYRQPDATTFNGTWVSLMYVVTTYGTRFN